MGLKRDAFRLDSFIHLNKHLKTFKEREKSMQPFCIVGHIKKYAKVQRVIEDWKNAGEVAKYRYRVLCFYDKHGLDATQNF